VIHSFRDGEIEDTGPLTKKRMETIDDDTVAAAIGFIRRQEKAGQPWFVWWNGTRMHFRTHVSEEMRTKADKIAGKHVDEYQAGMIEHDLHIGEFLDLLDELGIADKTLVHYSTDNGPHYNTWPDAAATPFFGEKNTNWEGGWRVPALMRWPGVIPAGSVSKRRDPYERSYRTSNTYWDWLIDRIFLLVPAQQYVGKFLATFQEYPPRMKPASFSIDQVMETLQTSGQSH
jgi:arylsulfatase A-like enzyme